MILSIKKKQIAICILFGIILPCSALSAEMTHGDMSMALRMVLYNAQKSFEKNDFKEGLQILERFKASGKAGSDHYLVDFWAGNALLQIGELTMAVQNYQAAAAKNPDFSSAHLNLAKCLYDLDLFENAAKAFLKGYETSEEKNPEILFYAAASYITAEKSSEAIPILERLISITAPKARTEWKETLVHAYLADKEPGKAIPLMEQLVKIFTGKKKMQWLENLLYQYLTLDMKNEALALAEKLTEEDPAEPKWWKTLVHIHLVRNRERQALVALTIYGYLTSLSEKEQKLLADLHLMLGTPQKAVSMYETLRVSSNSNELIEKIIQCHQMAGQTEKALEWVNRGLVKNVTYNLLMMKGNLLYEMKRYDEAISVFEAATDKKSRDPGRPWLMIGYSAWLNDELEKAKSAFEKAAGYKQHKKDAAANIERIDRIIKSKS